MVLWSSPFPIIFDLINGVDRLLRVLLSVLIDFEESSCTIYLLTLSV